MAQERSPESPFGAPKGSPTALAELLAAFPKGDVSPRRARASGLFGSARGFVLTQLSLSTGRPLLCVVKDEESADALERDLRLFSGAPEATETAPRVLRIPGDEVLPYEGLTPDRMVAQMRLAALFHLHLSALPKGVPRAIVLSVQALARKVIPRAELDQRSLQLSKEMEIDRDELARRLSAAGYLKAPLVEDPGTFAVRGGVFDVWSPLATTPVRLEFFGDFIETIRAFDPVTQRSVSDLTELSLCPAREIVLDDAGKKRAVAAVRAAADLFEVPTRLIRERIDELSQAGQDDQLLAAGLSPLLPGFFDKGLDALTAYLPDDALVVLDDPLELERQWSDLWRDLTAAFNAAKAKGELAFPPEQHFVHERDLRARLESKGLLELSQLGMGRGAGAQDVIEKLEDMQSEPEVARGTSEVMFALGETQSLRGEIQGHHGESGALEPLVRRLQSFRERGIVSFIACHSTALAERTKRLLLDRNLMAQLVDAPDPLLLRRSSDAAGVAAHGAYGATLYDSHIHAQLLIGEVSAGFVDTATRIALFSDEDLFGPRALVRKQGRRPKTFGADGADFRDLKEGDLVVHVEHGIARYDGLVRLNVRGIAADFIQLQFAGKDKLYLPVGRLRQIQKYTGADPQSAKLDSLKSQTFQKRKARVKEELLKMAAELLEVYAARSAHEGHAFNPPDALYLQFESDFEFDETPDQAKAIDDVLRDMQKPKPMDRLVCGDVGYGKTEVALRAAFKAVEDKKQVAVLVPTTVLCAQHFRTFQKRFKDYPISVEMVSRFRDPKEHKEILQRAREGRVDVIIGTHRLLNPDVSFKDLGLLIVDEEQRFGVKHKEQIKKLKKLVDVLTLSATPIPRTLNMAMMGVRDLSLITTPPVDRRAIRTFVCKFEGHTIKEAIERELSRGGQVFFLHNRVQSILGVKDYLQKLVPQAKIAVAHGQMAEGKLEEVMTEFVEKKHDVLLCTAIIESGLDIPSANTILVNRADTFGLSQLYQIRGRVGRSRERAYAYLLVPARRPMTRDAQKRLQVLQQFTELGAGFQIASHDLEMRGAGNLLGPDQSGTIEAVGFELYTQLLEEAVSELRGEPLREEIEPDVELPVAALISEDYVPEVQQRLYFYKKLAQAQSEEELYDVKGELRDTCGETPPETDALVEVMSLKIVLRALRMRGLKSGPARLVVQLGPDALLDPQKLAGLVARGKGRYRLTPGMELVEHLPVEATPPGEKPKETPAHAVLESARRLLQELNGCALRD
ncbi:MAG: transcription-repair coupling factor [Deltaproteobacteria bacterium]|nr:transcription-repair coupling factor [Deltaproteobacteria bacterium]